MLQKFEADVRQHIRIEQQLKLHIETIQEKLEEDEKLLEKYKLEKSINKERFKREMARMDEVLTIRESEINKLEQKVDSLKICVSTKDSTISEITAKLEETQLQLERATFKQKQERRIRTKQSKNNENRTHFSKSNERKDLSEYCSNFESKVINNAISQTILPK